MNIGWIKHPRPRGMDNHNQPKLAPYMRRIGIVLIVSGVACLFYSFWIDPARMHDPTAGVPIGGLYR